MRFDSEGLFWVDLPPEPVVKAQTVEKRTPPERTWEAPDYLPEIDEAKSFSPQLFSDEELVQAAISRKRLICDVECYPNYFLACFRCCETKKAVIFESYEDSLLNKEKLAWMLINFCLIGFHLRAYDLPMLQLAAAGASPAVLKQVSDKIIKEDIHGAQVVKDYQHAPPCSNFIDLIEVAPLNGSLKLYGGRLHSRRLQDLPFPEGTVLSQAQALIVKWYCFNDLDLTEDLYTALSEQIMLREALGQQYGIDLRSLSDAQIAETLIQSELKRLGHHPRTVLIPAGTEYKYEPPEFIKFKTDYMNQILLKITEMPFVVGDNGYVTAPDDLMNLQVFIADGCYQMGLGGLHSSEKTVTYRTCDSYSLVDYDVASYYPLIILTCQIYPPHLGPDFLKVYKTLVERRLAAKAAKNKAVADSLKIAINGTFGKLGSKWSVLYAPNLLFQVTVTGQLGLLMLVESFELAGIQVISANTDGIMLKIPKGFEDTAFQIVKEWEALTNFETERTAYRSFHSRDVNNYLAVRQDGYVKGKGAYSNPWKEKFPSVFRMHKNPVSTICIEAVEKFLTEGEPVENTIRQCKDMRKFVSVRTVRGGAVQGGVYLGRVIRWYYSTSQIEDLIYASSGNLVPRSAGAKPLLTLSETLPEDIDYSWYEREALKIIGEVGA